MLKLLCSGTLQKASCTTKYILEFNEKLHSVRGEPQSMYQYVVYAIIKQYKALLAFSKVNIEFTVEAISAIAEKL